LKNILKSLNSTFLLSLTVISILSIILIYSSLVAGEISSRSKEIAEYAIDTKSERISEIKKTIDTLTSFIYYNFRNKETSLLQNCRDRLQALSNYCSFTPGKSSICDQSKIFGKDFIIFENYVDYFISDFSGNILFTASSSITPSVSGSVLQSDENLKNQINKQWRSNLSTRNIELHDDAGFLYQNNFLFIKNDKRKFYFVYYLDKPSLYSNIASEIFRSLFDDLSDQINFFAGTIEGVSLAGPEMGRNMILDPTGNSAEVVKSLIAKAQSGGGIVEYRMPPVEGAEDEEGTVKMSYVTALPLAGAYVGSGVYLEDIERELGKKRKELARIIFSDLEEELVIALFASLFIVLAAVFIRA
jgi:hypothetical protein